MRSPKHRHTPARRLPVCVCVCVWSGGAYTTVAYPNTNSNVPDVRPLYYALW
jgi:hypothetical protein